MMADNDPPPDNVVPFAKGSGEASEDTIATAFVNIHHETIRYDHDAGRWYEWNGIHWVPDRVDRGLHYAREISRRMGEGKKTMCKASVAAGAERFARADPRVAVTAEYWDQDPMLLGTPGGIVDLRTRKLIPPDPEKRITKITAATPAKGEPERWLAFLDQATGGDAEVIGFLQEWCGYCLTGDTREHTLLFAYGAGGNGKSVLLTKPLIPLPNINHVLYTNAATRCWANEQPGG